jgi:hypothetical protein
MTPTDRALAFLAAQDRPLEAAWARHTAGTGDRAAVLAALAEYQNPDGGFGRGLEPDIGAPASNPFAARLAIYVLLSLGADPGEPIARRLDGWLETSQDEDGCWRLPPDLADHPVAPWFAAWTFPSLNPALCLAGLAARLGLGSDRMQARVRALADRLASVEEVQTGEFYALLPYAEYFPFVAHPDQARYLDALAARIVRNVETDAYEDASHCLDQIGPPDGEVARRLPPALVATQLDRLLAEQQPDGGWPTPYDPHWRPWTAASALDTLRAHGRL